MDKPQLDADLIGRAVDARESCYGVIRGLQLMQQSSNDEDAALAGGAASIAQ